MVDIKKNLSIPKKIIKIIKTIVNQVNQEITVQKIVLYGSYSIGNYNKSSDVDIAFFISDNNQNLRETYNYINKICSLYSVDIQPQVFYAYELEEPIGIIEEIVEYGTDVTNL
jgi:predicted nucleotidyltransferase